VLDYIFLHSNNCAHRDLKPENILVGSQDDPSAIKLADFGHAKQVGDQLEIASRVRGTLAYNAPETKANLFGKFSDMWALGMIQLEMRMGELPFDPSTKEELFWTIAKCAGDSSYLRLDKLYSNHPQKQEIDNEMRKRVECLLALDPDRRPDIYFYYGNNFNFISPFQRWQTPAEPQWESDDTKLMLQVQGLLQELANKYNC